MDNWTFGITVTVVGMVGTLMTLWLLSLFMLILKKIFPLNNAEKQPAGTRKKGAGK